MGRLQNRNNVWSVGGTIPVFFAVSIVFAGLYLFGHINQLQETIIRPGSGYLNITNIMLCILGVLEAAFPVLILLKKDNLLKIDLYLISAMYLIGNLWFFRWIYTIIATGSVSFDFAAYQLSWFNMFNHTTWASRNAETLLLNYANMFLWFNIARNIDRDKKKTCINMGIMLIVSFILPIAFFGLTRFRLIPEWWIKKSITLFVSFVSLFIAMILATKKKKFWNRYVCILRDNNKN